MPRKKAPAVIEVTSLDQLDRVEQRVEIERPDGAILAVTLRSLNAAEMDELRDSVDWPSPPRAFASARPGEKPRLGPPNPDDPAYLKQLRQNVSALQYRMVVRCLTFDIPGENLDEQVEHLRTSIGQWAMKGIGDIVMAMHGITEDEIEERSKNSPLAAG